MKHPIPEHILEEIRTRADLVEVVSDFVLLKKSGKNYKGLCPFHSEKTPSFTVSPDKQIYHCFGCSAGGNVFKFLMELEDCSFIDAVKKLAERTHVHLPQTLSRTARQKQTQRDHCLKLHQEAADYFVHRLQQQGDDSPVRQYLKRRHLDAKTLASYQIGWALPAWRGLLTHLERKVQSSRADLEKAGLVVQKQGSQGDGFYDRFRGRLMFPLKDVHGKIIAFAGRVIDQGEPKYLNSPETPLYKKGRHLFGLDQAREAIRKEDGVLITEGYFDQIRCVQHGIRNVVASCGTALTPAQGELLKRFTRNVTLVFDSDSAGQSAARRGFEVLLEQGMQVKILVLPPGHDPDSFILQEGGEEFLRQIEIARPYIESYIMNVAETDNLGTPQGRAEAVNRILPLFCKIQNHVERSEWIRFFSEKTGVEDKALLAELKKALDQNRTAVEVRETDPARRGNPESYLLHLVLAHPRLGRDLRDRLKLEDVGDPHVRQIFADVFEEFETGGSVQLDRLLDRAQDPQVRAVLTEIALKPIEFDDVDRALADCLGALRRKNVQTRIRELKKQRNEAEQAGQVERSREIHKKLQEIQVSLAPG